jgi:hypothetical protein
VVFGDVGLIVWIWSEGCDIYDVAGEKVGSGGRDEG